MICMNCNDAAHDDGYAQNFEYGNEVDCIEAIDPNFTKHYRFIS